jgi:hypothetical protein
MTDREKLCELICDGTNHDCGKRCNLTSVIKCYSCTSLADHLIANGVTVQRWIPVAERLPEPFVSVLVQMPREKPFLTVREGYITKAGIWYSALYGRKPDEVTHWMPLPEPPKED